jgi:Fibrillar collagen C-terminal domain
MYYIDPFEVGAGNGLLVYCDRDTSGTCMKPETQTYKLKKWLKTDKNETHVYFMRDMRNDFNGVSILDLTCQKQKSKQFFPISVKFTYSNNVFLKKLRKASNGGYQKLTYKCRNSIAYQDIYGNLNKAIVIKMSSDEEFYAEHKIFSSYKVLKDDCKVNPRFSHAPPSHLICNYALS